LGYGTGSAILMVDENEGIAAIVGSIRRGIRNTVWAMQHGGGGLTSRKTPPLTFSDEGKRGGL
jgi:hypothetical protein